MKFKVGDKVVAKYDYQGSSTKYGDTFKAGVIYTISGETDGFPRLKELEGKTAHNYWAQDAFKLVDDNIKPQEDIVNLPKHYTMGKIQVLDFIEDQKLQFHEAQVLKYVVRAKHKGNELQDLKKAKFYLDRLIGNLENANKD